MISDKKVVDVFISYSHDSDEHKKWVRKFADALHAHALNPIADCYDECLKFGENLGSFMAKGTESAKVICIVTEQYCQKANEGKGGAGYEANIITAEVIKDQNTAKFIPILINNPERKMPKCLSALNYEDFSDTSDIEKFKKQIEKIGRHIHEIPERPKPLPQIPSYFSQPKDSFTAEEIIVNLDNLDSLYQNALYYAKNNDIDAFHELSKKTKNLVFSKLNNTRLEWEKKFQEIKTKEDLFYIADEFIQIAAPLLLIAFSGIKSRNPKFISQKGILYDLCDIPGWYTFQRTNNILRSIPEFLAYVYYHLYGALLISLDSTNELFSIIEQRIPCNHLHASPSYDYAYNIRSITGWPETLGRDCFDSFKYLSSAFQRWNWLALIFDDEESYQFSLSVYQTLLYIYDYTNYLKESGDDFSKSELLFKIKIPPSFALISSELSIRVVSYLVRHADIVSNICDRKQINTQEVIKHWPNWLRAMGGFSVGNPSFSIQRPFQELMQNVLIS